MKSGFRARGVSASALRCRRFHSIGRRDAVPHGSAVPGARAGAPCKCRTCYHCAQQPGELVLQGSACVSTRWVHWSTHSQLAVSFESAPVGLAPTMLVRSSSPGSKQRAKHTPGCSPGCTLRLTAVALCRLPRRKARWTLGLPALLCCLLLACSASVEAEHRRRRRYRAHSPTGDPHASGGALHYGGPAGEDALEGGQ